MFPQFWKKETNVDRPIFFHYPFFIPSLDTFFYHSIIWLFLFGFRKDRTHRFPLQKRTLRSHVKMPIPKMISQRMFSTKQWKNYSYVFPLMVRGWDINFERKLISFKFSPRQPVLCAILDQAQKESNSRMFCLFIPETNIAEGETLELNSTSFSTKACVEAYRLVFVRVGSFSV